jgi:hypothetical protein
MCFTGMPLPEWLKRNGFKRPPQLLMQTDRRSVKAPSPPRRLFSLVTASEAWQSIAARKVVAFH